MPSGHDIRIGSQSRLPKSHAMPHGLRFPIAIDITPHRDIIRIDQIDDFPKPSFPRIVQIIIMRIPGNKRLGLQTRLFQLDPPKRRRLRNHNRPFLSLCKLQDVLHILHRAPPIRRPRKELLKDRHPHPVDVVVPGIKSLQRQPLREGRPPRMPDEEHFFQGLVAQSPLAIRDDLAKGQDVHGGIVAVSEGGVVEFVSYPEEYFGGGGAFDVGEEGSDLGVEAAGEDGGAAGGAVEVEAYLESGVGVGALVVLVVCVGVGRKRVQEAIGVFDPGAVVGWIP
mmetsp:Transcript_9/g.19  ORF Transcript_9/g.19 Transcript_9/m.19 type:complete len:281 (+) Transcript_9:384-1226(+)